MTALPPGLAVEVNFEGVSGTALIWDDATRGLWDTGTWGGDTSFVDMVASGRVRGGRIQRGATSQNGPYARADAGTAEVVLDNRDAALDPTNLSGPYVAGGVTQVQPMRAWRIRAGAYDLWRGFADAWDLDYPSSGHDATCTLRGTDATKVLANYDGPEQAPAGAGEDTGARIGRILDSAGWPSADRDLDVGLTNVIATTLAQPALTELLLTADTEGGELYVSAAGKVVFRNRHAVLTEARSTTPQAIFGDGPGELPFTGLDLAHDDALLANLVRINRAGGVDSEQVVEDLASQATYLVRSFERSDLIHQTDAESLQMAEWVLGLMREGTLRFDSITVDPRDDPDTLYPAILGRELGDRIRVRWTPPGRPGDPIERDVHVRGIEHVFDAGGTWSTTFYLADAERFDQYARVGSAIVGRSRVAY